MYKVFVVLVVLFVQTKSHYDFEFRPLQPFYTSLPWISHLETIPPDPWPNCKKTLFFIYIDRRQKERVTTLTTPNKVKKDPSIVPPNKLQPPRNSANTYFNTLETSTKPEVVKPTYRPPCLIDRIKESIPSTTEQTKTTVISLEYKPTRPFYHPKPGDTLNQIVPPGKPWPASAQNSTVIKDRIKEDSVSTTALPQKQTPISLEYKPIKPFHHSNPGNTLKPIIPTAKPWLDSAQNSTVIKDRIKEMEKKTTTISTGFEWEKDHKSSTPSLVDRIQEDSVSTTQKTASMSLEYKPNKPFHHSNPGNTLKPIVPTGKPWPDSAQGYQNFSQLSPPNLVDRVRPTDLTAPSGFEWETDLEKKRSTTKPNLVDRIKDISTAAPSKENRPSILEYQPNRPFFHPNPGSTLGQIVPPGQPWPARPQDYQNFSQVAEPNLVNKIKESTPTTTGRPGQVPEQTTTISLEYKPSRPPFHPKPGNNVGQIIQPGQPLPSSPEDAQNGQGSKPALVHRIEDATTEKTISLEYKPSRPLFHQKPGDNVGQIIQPGQPLSSWPEDAQNGQASKPELVHRIEDATTEKTISLEYKPSRPSFHPKPGDNVGQIIQPEQPLPSSPEDVQNGQASKPELVHRIEDATTEKTISLEYKPSRPPFHPKPADNVGQVVPPGQPLPSSQGIETSKPDLINRIEAITEASTEKPPISLEYKPTRPPFHPNPGDTIGQIIPPGDPWPSKPEDTKTQIVSLILGLEERLKTTTVISLAYKPSRPFYHPRPGDTLSQIIPPGKPWPSSLEGYQGFSQTSPSVIDRFKSESESKPETTQAGFVWEVETSSEANEDKVDEDSKMISVVVPEDEDKVSEDPKETSTMGGRLYTSALKEIESSTVKNFDKGTKSGSGGPSENKSGGSRGDEEVTVTKAFKETKEMPLEVTPFNLLPIQLAV